MLKARWKYHVTACLKPALRDAISDESVGGMYTSLGVGARFFNFWELLYAKTWYVWYGMKLDNASFTTRYIGRYAKRPAMAESRIKEYDGEYVVFEYEDKKEGVHRVERLSVYVFLSRLIRHIHDKYYRVIRYAGIYSNRTKTRDCGIVRLLLKLREKQARPPVLWRERRIRESGDDPLECRYCSEEMVLCEIWYKPRDGPRLARVCG